MQHRVNLSRVRPVVLAVVALGLAGLGYGLWGGGGGAPQTGPAGGPPVTVSKPLQKQVTDWLDYSGQFSAVDYVEMRARVSGYLTEIDFTDGQMVKKGDLLFVIDPRPYQIALANARAKLDQAGSSKVFAHRQLDRAGELREKDFLSQSTLDQRVQESRGAGAGVDSALSALREAELNLQFTHIEAPISGRIGAHKVGIGNLVSGGGSGGTSTLLTTIVSLDPIHFDFDLSEADYLALQRQLRGRAEPLPVLARLGDESGWPHEGHLDFIDNQVDRGSGTIRARAVFANALGAITPGSFGHIHLAVSQPYDALLIPDAAIMTDQNTRLVLTVTPDGTVAPRPVQLGQMVDGLRVVRGGVTPEDSVIINGLLRARPGAKVTAMAGSITPVAQ
jgi:RND family efflux transporter MFP subunit